MTDSVMQAFLSQHRRTDSVRDDRILNCAPSFDLHYKKLIAIPGIADIVSSIHRAFRQRVSELKTKLVERVASGNSEKGIAEFVAVLGNAD